MMFKSKIYDFVDYCKNLFNHNSQKEKLVTNENCDEEIYCNELPGIPFSIQLPDTQVIEEISSEITSKPLVEDENEFLVHNDESLNSVDESTPEDVVESESVTVVANEEDRIGYIETENFVPKLKFLKPQDLDEFPPGFIADTNIFHHFEDHPEFLLKGKKFGEKFGFSPIYVISKSLEEFTNKRKPKNHYELVRSWGNGNTGGFRDLQALLERLPMAFNRDIYYVDISDCTPIHQKSMELMKNNVLTDNYGLHDADSIFLAFAKITNSQLVTCDKNLINCCVQTQCRFLRFPEFAEKVMQPSPITIIERERKTKRKIAIKRKKQSKRLRKKSVNKFYR